MSTTTIRLGDLKERIAIAAQHAGKSPHAYIVDAISESVARDEQRAEFVNAALARRQKYLASGRSVSFEAMEAYALASARDEKRAKPTARAKKSVKSA
ncbi:CopG family ribbon-helix-helix protein [Caenimonas koreensis]|uniref:CopG family transcriptional regulator n=1 Tax=Caenimonas koreensis DSM 17982 TaxID=1121255 RepID=A0A844B0S1_9BURK|nr:CopG family transcriptional regulator [Caenimonas koreensis]MRD46723.1 CopG family transcriptional regulator [Caenimonas koreensis DSM 17982]